ncbi:MAG: hypothetical protein Aurels2KO_56630 [Aureliella sp.]
MFPGFLGRFVCIMVPVISCAGCLESSFRLSDESRIPYFFQMPEGADREDVYVTLDYYSAGNGKSVFKLYRSDQFYRIDKVEVEVMDDDHLRKLQTPPPGYPSGYPSYEIIRVRGVVDVIEHRRMEPVFFTTDDSAIWTEFGLTQGESVAN